MHRPEMQGIVSKKKTHTIQVWDYSQLLTAIQKTIITNKTIKNLKLQNQLVHIQRIECNNVTNSQRENKHDLVQCQHKGTYYYV